MRYKTILRLLFAISVILSGCATWTSGLAPIYPRHNETINTLSPTFVWQAAKIEGAQYVVYELVVVYPDDSIAYQAARIPQNHHTVQVPFSPGLLYRWTVRPVYYKNGKWLSEPWNRRRNFWYGGVVVGWGSDLYRFRTPDVYVPQK